MGDSIGARSVFAWSLRSYLEAARSTVASGAAELIVSGDLSAVQAYVQSQKTLPAWYQATLKWEEGELWVVPCSDRPLIVLKPKSLSEAQLRDGAALAPSPYSQVRDLAGRAWAELRRLKLDQFSIKFLQASREMQLGLLVGLDLASYTYKSSSLSLEQVAWPRWDAEVESSLVKEAAALARGVNLARHLVNTPPNRLYPESFASEISALFSGREGLTIEIWDADRLKREGMGLHLAVGGGSENRPCLLKLRYRPKATKSAPIVLVGKGVTFDSGGLDIKDAAGMRLMKKDMGGAAAVVGAIYSYLETDGRRPFDVYVPLAENAISGKAYRPGDIIRARSGMTVEIHNTDAEGRLVLADSLALAAAEEGDEKPAAIIVAATLTGAIKVGLGSDIAGLFSTSDKLADALQRTSKDFGDPMWRMPLYEPYRPKLETTVADINHCATGSYGGAITAALFLAEFVKGHPFAHLDIYSWTDGERGALREGGGSGQAVQALTALLKNFET